MAAIFSWRHFQMHFGEFNVWISIKISLVLFLTVPLTISSIDTDNGLVSARRQAIIWTNDG